MVDLKVLQNFREPRFCIAVAADVDKRESSISLRRFDLLEDVRIPLLLQRVMIPMFYFK